MKATVIGIMPQEQIRKRVLAIARGEYKPKPGDPQVWFTSVKSLASALSDGNSALLKVISEAGPAESSTTEDSSHGKRTSKKAP